MVLKIIYENKVVDGLYENITIQVLSTGQFAAGNLHYKMVLKWEVLEHPDKVVGRPAGDLEGTQSLTQIFNTTLNTNLNRNRFCLNLQNTLFNF